MPLRYALIGLLTLLWVVPASAVPTGWFSWTNTAGPDTDTYAGQWEDTPAGAEAASLGDDRIRQLKYNIRLRANAEHCWDASTTTGCPSSPTGANSGRSRLGSGRAFVTNSAPTNLSTTDANGSSALDSGRFWFDEDGRQGGQLNDDFELKVYNSSGVWVPALAMGRDPIAGTGAYKQWDGTSWLTQTPFTAIYSKGVNTTANLIIAVGAPVAIALTAADPAVTTPATGAYLIHVTIPTIQYNSNVGGAFSTGTFQLTEDDGGGAVVVQTCEPTSLQGAGLGYCSFDYYKDAPTLSKTYTYGLLAGAATNSGIINQNNNTVTVNVVLESKYGMRGY